MNVYRRLNFPIANLRHFSSCRQLSFANINDPQLRNELIASTSSKLSYIVTLIVLDKFINTTFLSLAVSVTLVRQFLYLRFFLLLICHPLDSILYLSWPTPTQTNLYSIFFSVPSRYLRLFLFRLNLIFLLNIYKTAVEI